MKKTKKMIAIVSSIAVVGAFALTACGGNQSGGSPAPQPEPAQTEAAQPESTPAAVEQNGIAGEYVLYAVGQKGTFYGAEEYSEFINSFISGIADTFGADENTQSDIKNTFSGESKLSLKDDGNGELIIFGMKATCTWSADQGDLTLKILSVEGSEDSTISEGSEMKGSYDDKGLITLTDSEGAQLIFAADGADTSEIETSSLKDSLTSGLNN